MTIESNLNSVYRSSDVQRLSAVLIYIVSEYSNRAFGFFRASLDQSFPMGIGGD